MPTAQEFCTHPAVVALPDEPLPVAAARMRDEHVGSLVVVRSVPGGNLRPVGILTDRDIVVGVVARTDRDVKSMLVGDVMSADPATAKQDEDLDTLIKRMRTNGIRRMPVIDDRGYLVGIVAFDDLVFHLQEQLTDLTRLLGTERHRELAERLP